MELDLFLEFVSDLLALVPVISFGAPLIAFIIDVLKRFGLKDGLAPLVSGLLNAALYAVVWLAGEQHLAEVQTIVEALAAVGPVVLALVLSLLGTARVHDALAGIGIGYSHPKTA